MLACAQPATLGGGGQCRQLQGTLTFLRQFELEGIIQAVATAAPAFHQTLRRPVEWAGRKWGCARKWPDDRDTTVDIRAGRAAGAQTVGVLCGFGHEKELRRAGADLILEQTAQLTELLVDPCG